MTIFLLFTEANQKCVFHLLWREKHKLYSLAHFTFLSTGISRPRADSAPPTPVNRMSMSPPPSITNTTPPHSRKQRHTVATKTASKSSTVSSSLHSVITNDKCRVRKRLDLYFCFNCCMRFEVDLQTEQILYICDTFLLPL